MALSYIGSATGVSGVSSPGIGATINTPEDIQVGDLVISTVNFGPNTPAMFSSLYVTLYLVGYGQSGSFDSTICFAYTYDGGDYFISYEYLEGPQLVDELAVATSMVFRSDAYPNRAVASCVLETITTGSSTTAEAFISTDIHVYCLGATNLLSTSVTPPSGTNTTVTSFDARDDGLGEVADVTFVAAMGVDLVGSDATETLSWTLSGGNNVHSWGFRVAEVVPGDHSEERNTDDRAVASGLEYLVYTDTEELSVNKYNWTTGETRTLAGGGSFQSLTDVTLFFNNELAYACDYVGQKIYQINSAANANPVTTEIYDFSLLHRFPYRIDACTGTTPNELYLLDISFSEVGIDPSYTNLTKLTFDGSSWVSQVLLTIPYQLPLDLAVSPNGVVWILTDTDTSPYLYRWTLSPGKILMDDYGSTPGATGSNPKRLTARADDSAYVTFGYADYYSGDV